MSRNKENNPLPPSRAVASVFIGKQPTPPSAEFFTDSLLEDTSRIPSPSPLKNKHAVSKPRRALGSSKPLHVSRDPNNLARNPTSSHEVRARGIRHQPPAPTLQRPLSIRSSNSDLITPPQSRDGPESIKSPMSVDSVPSHDLTDTYQRIYDEEELAATEREPLSSEDDEEEMDFDGQMGSPSKAPRSATARNSWAEPLAARNPTQHPVPDDADKENLAEERTGRLSEDTGMSFLAQLTDKDLAAKMTPHMTEHAKDMRRLQKGISTRPISFHAGTKPSEFIADDARSNASSGGSSRSYRRRNLRLNSPAVGGVAKAHSDTSLDARPRSQVSPAAQRSQQQSSPVSREPLRPLNIQFSSQEAQDEPTAHGQVSDDEGDETSAELRARERQFGLNRAKKLFGISGAVEATHEVSNANAPGTFSGSERQGRLQDGPGDHGDLTEDGNDFTQSSIRSQASDRSEFSVLRASSNKVPVTNKGILRKWARTAAEQQAERTQSVNSDIESSQVDWAGAAADVPLPSVENREVEAEAEESASPEHRRSAEGFRRVDNEMTGMTGMSFQVSESPPVKTKKSFDDILREKEMSLLSKQAVTKSRLEAIRERDPREAQRQLSRSPSGSSLRKSLSNDATTPQQVEKALEQVGEQIPDTPVVVFRSSSNNSRDLQTSGERPGHDRQSSHDTLQRFARLSATPKSSPSILPKLAPSNKQSEVEGKNERRSSEGAPQAKKPFIAATPKVTGAWTDTILPPDTINTVKAKPQPKYTQTPNVTVGGWVATPHPTISQRPSSAPEAIEEEVLEDLATDIMPNRNPRSASSHARPLEQQAATTEVNRPPVGQSALSNILAAQRARHSSGAADDTLDLGDATMASLEDLVDLNEEDITTLIRLGAEQDALQQLGENAAGTAIDGDTGDQKEGEIMVLDRLARKLHTLQSNIRHARRAVGRFEREMSEGVDEALAHQPHSDPLTPQILQQTPLVPTQLSSAGLVRGTGVFPILYSTLTLPLPLLFHTPKHRQHQLPQGRWRMGKPTPLLYVLLFLLAYYVLETLLSELYAHPLYAETYAWPAANQAPEPDSGLVVPTLLARVFGGDVQMRRSVKVAPAGAGTDTLEGWAQGLWVLGRAVVRLFAGGDGFVDGPAQGHGGVGASPAATTAAAAGAQRGDGWSMMNDEIL
ncbi:uncharacterized protein HMPREF1541_00909 [Cyphellophora europaea CBS 101466]|uniref:Uncharacterized protein n=1 Tax=Cyphellophora europaea (strain CBS 101466) TaxID=1220924 RepID=W2SDL8_CYPE1|nr:uncharacterized protein HMPREF1541_00909 [Cyphellophora europaea CBS 101466]ETN46720.1 hypothetical protein HMPREF1541_00909 [Cyphellophora europaea CBS 101466]